MRTLTDHIVEGDSANHQLTITVTDTPGQGGACHHYDITGFDLTKNKAAATGQPRGHIHIVFQEGSIKEFGVNGVTNEVFLAILIDRLRSFQAGPFAGPMNAIALAHCEGALSSLQERTRERLARGVEGLTVV